MMTLLRAGFLAVAIALPAAADTVGRFGIDDYLRIADVAEPAFSPDGQYLAYSVMTNDLEKDEPHYDLWRVRWDGSERRALTQSAGDDEWLPKWSPDGEWIAFLSDRGGEDAKTQVWAMPAAGGEAEKLTTYPAALPISPGHRTAAAWRSSQPIRSAPKASRSRRNRCRS